MTKLYVILSSVILLSMLTIPLTAATQSIAPQSVKSTQAAAVDQKVTNVPENSTQVKILRTKNNKIEKTDLLEYLTGVVAAEIGADYENEAIKAQAVAAHTMLLYRESENSGKDYDITDSSETDQSYFDKDERKKTFGDKFDADESKLREQINSVINKTVTYDGKPILAAYFDLSGGKTESAKNVWGTDYKYLQPVESVSDMLSPKYISTVTFSKDEFTSIASSLKVTAKGDASKWVSLINCSQSGTVLEITLCGKKFSGKDIRKAFQLRSANFDLDYKNDSFIFTVRGSGHGVGMSQNGANYMAKQGSKYDEILKWYYKGVQISG